MDLAVACLLNSPIFKWVELSLFVIAIAGSTFSIYKLVKRPGAGMDQRSENRKSEVEDRGSEVRG